jgi:NAD-dependent SIR2 family protein deacetylase
MSVNNWKDNYLRPDAIGMYDLRTPKYCAECGAYTNISSKASKPRIVCYGCVIREKAEKNNLASSVA